MTMGTLESGILRECRRVIGNPKLRIKDIRAWSIIGPVEAMEGEIEVWLPDIKCNLVVPVALDRRGKH